MTATSDRQRDQIKPPPGVAWDERAVFGRTRGWPWWAVVLLALGLAVVGTAVDVIVNGSPGILFKGAYLVGCVGAICVVQRRAVFTAMVQPPLILAITVPGTILLLSGNTGGGLRSQLLAIATPLIKGFPTMAIVTIITVAIGIARLVLQRPPTRTASARARSTTPPSKTTAGKAAPRKAAAGKTASSKTAATKATSSRTAPSTSAATKAKPTVADSRAAAARPGGAAPGSASGTRSGTRKPAASTGRNNPPNAPRSGRPAAAGDRRSAQAPGVGGTDRRRTDGRGSAQAREPRSRTEQGKPPADARDAHRRGSASRGTPGGAARTGESRPIQDRGTPGNSPRGGMPAARGGVPGAPPPATPRPSGVPPRNPPPRERGGNPVPPRAGSTYPPRRYRTADRPPPEDSPRPRRHRRPPQED